MPCSLFVACGWRLFCVRCWRKCRQVSSGAEAVTTRVPGGGTGEGIGRQAESQVLIQRPRLIDDGHDNLQRNEGQSYPEWGRTAFLPCTPRTRDEPVGVGSTHAAGAIVHALA